MVRKSNENFVDNLRLRNRELEATNTALQEAQEELLLRDRLSTLGKFSSLILHDIRNPISILRGLAEMILLQGGERDKVDRNAKRIIQEVDRLNRLASELLDYSRGEIRLDMTVANLNEFFLQIIESIEEKFTALNITIKTDISFAGPILFDHQRMYRVFMNLADNARKAMPQGGTFSIAVIKNEKTVTFGVSDTGVGMSAEVKKKNAIGFIGRGVERKVMFFPDIAPEECPSCRECFSICPTGIMPENYKEGQVPHFTWPDKPWQPLPYLRGIRQVPLFP